LDGRAELFPHPGKNKLKGPKRCGNGKRLTDGQITQQSLKKNLRNRARVGGWDLVESKSQKRETLGRRPLGGD